VRDLAGWGAGDADPAVDVATGVWYRPRLTAAVRGGSLFMLHGSTPTPLFVGTAE